MNAYYVPRKKKLLCLRCQRFGFSSRNLTKYSCACNSWPLGHLNFRAMDIANWKRGRIQELQCRICRQEDPHQRNKEPNEKFQCRVCGSVETGLEAFNTSILFNYRVHRRTLLCADCQKKGLSSYDFNRYFCRICNCEAGHLHFVKITLHNFRQRLQLSPICKTCWAKGDRLLQLLRRKDAWKCQCKVYKGLRPHR